MDDLYSRSVTYYCERTDIRFYSEPLNALSNISFFISAILVYRLLKKKNANAYYYRFLPYLLLFIGTGSLLWHSFRNPFTLVLDAIPIWIFFLLIIFILIHKLARSKNTATIILTSYFFIQVLASYVFTDFFNGSIRHVVNGVAFVGIIAWVYKKYAHVSGNLIAAFLLYILAIVFRSIDNAVCAYLTVGTHFLWHILNAIAAYLAIKVLLDIDLLENKSSSRILKKS